MRVQKGYVNTTWTKEGTGIFDVGNVVCVTQSTPAAVLLGRIYPSFCRAACEFQGPVMLGVIHAPAVYGSARAG